MFSHDVKIIRYNGENREKQNNVKLRLNTMLLNITQKHIRTLNLFMLHWHVYIYIRTIIIVIYKNNKVNIKYPQTGGDMTMDLI